MCSLRGVGGNLIVCEEAAFIDPKVFYEVVVPLLEVKATALLAISTPLSQANHYSELCNSVGKDGQPVFRVVKVGLVCDACIEAGLQDRCTHMAGVKPAWKSEEGRDVVQALYGSRSTLFQRESLGLIADDANVVFPPAAVAAMFSAARVQVTHDSLDSIFVCIDPSGGGASEFACVSVVEIGQKFVVSLPLYHHLILLAIPSHV